MFHATNKSNADKILKTGFIIDYTVKKEGNGAELGNA